MWQCLYSHVLVHIELKVKMKHSVELKQKWLAQIDSQKYKQGCHNGASRYHFSTILMHYGKMAVLFLKVLDDETEQQQDRCGL